MHTTISRILVCGAITFAGTSVPAQAPKLEQQYPAPCNTPDMAMVSIGNCLDLEYAIADSALNAAYKLVQKRLGTVRFAAVRDEQRQWLSRRNGIRPDENGGNHPSMSVLPSLVSMTRARVFELRYLALSADDDQANTLPVQVTFRLGSAGRGLVLQIRNQTATQLQVTARMYDPWSDQLRSQPISIGPRAVAEVGWAEGWRFESGHMVELLHGSYAGRLAVAP